MSDSVLIVMLGYKSQAGKDTIYTSVGESLGFERVAFADKLKQTVSDLYGFSWDQMHGHLKDVEDTRYVNNRDTGDHCKYFTPRRILQIFGGDQRSINPDIWAYYAFNVTIPKLIASNRRKIMLTDFRFRNEAVVADKWRSSNRNVRLEFVHVDRPGQVSETAADDISENDLNEFRKWTGLLSNDSTLDILKKRSFELLSSYL